jgi:ATP-dependent DNA ligase
MPFEPMLATNRVSQPLAGEWVLEPKFDGWRAIERLPELAPLVD